MPRTVLHMIETLGPGGAETVLMQLVRGLGREWSSVVHIPRFKGWLSRELERTDTPYIARGTNRPFDVGFLIHLCKVVRAQGVDLVHAHLLDSGAYASLASRLLRVPCIVTLHGEVDFLGDGVTTQLKRHLVAWATKVTFPSRSLRDAFLRHVRTGESRASVVPNGIDGEVFRPLPRESCRRRLGYAPDSILIGALGNVRPAKDYHTFLRAAALLAARDSRYRFAIAGDTRSPLYAPLLMLRNELGLADPLDFLDFTEDVPAFLGALDVLAISSQSEGFSLAAVQAMACEVPVVATRCGGTEEVLGEGEYGVLVPPADPRALAEGIQSVVELPDADLTLLKTRGRQRAAEFYSDREMVRRYAAAYREVLGMTESDGEGELLS